MTRTAASAKRINQVFETVPSVQEKNTEPIETDETAPKIEFEHVCFNYNDDGDDELTDVSFAVPRGATVGVMGAGVGSGVAAGVGSGVGVGAGVVCPQPASSSAASARAIHILFL